DGVRRARPPRAAHRPVGHALALAAHRSSAWHRSSRVAAAARHGFTALASNRRPQSEWRLPMTDFDVLADGLYFPEGPIACDDGSVVVGEIVGRRLTKIAPDGTKATLAEIDGGPNGLAVGPDNAIYICDNGGLSARLVDGKMVPGDPHAPRPLGSVKRLDLASGEVTTLFTECDGLPLAGPNDLVFAADGTFWFT